MPSNHNKSKFKITETAPFPPRRLSNTSIAIHSNSIAGYVIMFTIRLLYSKPILSFLTWVMRRTVANINPKIIYFDGVDFSGHHSKKLYVSFDAQCSYELFQVYMRPSTRLVWSPSRLIGFNAFRILLHVLIVTLSKKSCHITPVLKDLLPVRYRILFYSLSSLYISNLLSFYTPSRNLRSNKNCY